MGSERIEIVIVAGHPVIRGVVRMACDAIESSDVVAEAMSVFDASEVLGRTSPDLVILDLDLPDGDGLALLKGVVAPDADREGRRPRVCVLSDRTDGMSILEVLRLGVDGYLTKSSGLRGLTGTLRRVVAGERVIDPDVERRAAEHLPRFADIARARASVEAVLTSREREVLSYLAEGFTIQQIGRRLGISPRTVETHVAKLYRKLSARTRVQAVSRAASLGLIDLR